MSDGSVDAARSKGFTTAATRIGVGTYCPTIDPALGVDTAKTTWIASIDADNSATTAVAANYAPGTCPAGRVGVITVNGNGAHVDAAFSVIVP
jgi:hypothetical protein